MKNQFVKTVPENSCRIQSWPLCAGTKVFEEALNAVKFLGWLKKFGLAQNILGPVKGQGISNKNMQTFLMRNLR